MVSNRNFSGQATPVMAEGEYCRCNFAQPSPVWVDGRPRGVRLFAGDDRPRVFRECNLCNAEPPPGSTVVGCNTTIKEFDVSTDAAEAGEESRADVVHGWYDAASASYVYFDSPARIVSREGGV